MFLIYHIAQIINWKNTDIPSSITYTGMGSKYIRIILPDDQELTKYTDILLTTFTNKKLPERFDVYLTTKPKEATANGGLGMLIDNLDMIIHNADMVKSERIGYHGYDISDFPNVNYERLMNKDLDKITASVLNNIDNLLTILSSDIEITKFLLTYGLRFDLIEGRFKDVVGKYAKKSLQQMINNAKETGCDVDTIRESIFFWAFKDVFYQLS